MKARPLASREGPLLLAHRRNRDAGIARLDSGFTLVELALVVAVTAIVATVGFAALETYRVRAHVAEGIALALPLEDQVAGFFRRTGAPPRTLEDAGLGAAAANGADSIVHSIDIINGRIEIRFTETADEGIARRALSLTPFETADLEIVWICGNRIPGVGLKPLGFSAGGLQATQVLTMIEARYLPASCR